MWLRIIGILVLVLVLIAAGGAAYVIFKSPNRVAPSAERVLATPERLARGKYLFEYVADCNGCHSPRDWTRFGGPIVEGRKGAGFRFPDEAKMPGVVVAPNITPDANTGIGGWSDGEKLRAIRDGISRDGHALFAFMPYSNFRLMSDEDASSLIAYLNSLPPVSNSLPRTKLKFPLPYIMKFIPKPAGHVPEPDRSDRVKYGEYLVTVASCGTCHSADLSGPPKPGTAFSGGARFQMGTDLIVYSANITPDRETGIGKWDEAYFLKKFQDYRDYAEHGSPKAAGPDAFTVMPWLALSQLETDDLKAIYAYLRTVPSVKHYVEHHPGVQNTGTKSASLR